MGDNVMDWKCTKLICACLWQVLIAVFISLLRCVISMVVHSTVNAHTADRVSDGYELLGYV